MKNPPAFPNDFCLEENQGMTLRDYFAAQALPIMLGQMFRNEPSDEAIIAAISSCYLIADLMMKTRKV